jgi:hypothetical protein
MNFSQLRCAFWLRRLSDMSHSRLTYPEAAHSYVPLIKGQAPAEHVDSADTLAD